MCQKPKREFIKRNRLLKNRTHPVGGPGKSERGQKQTEQSAAQLVKFYQACGRNNFTSLLSTPHILWYMTSKWSDWGGLGRELSCVCAHVTVTGSNGDLRNMERDRLEDKNRGWRQRVNKRERFSFRGRHTDTPHLEWQHWHSAYH